MDGELIVIRKGQPDFQVMQMPGKAIPDPLKVQNHFGFLNDYLAELQDAGLRPSSVNNCIKTVK